MTSTQLLTAEPPKAAPTPFDYSTLTTEIATEMREYASRIRRLQQASVLGVGRASDTERQRFLDLTAPQAA